MQIFCLHFFGRRIDRCLFRQAVQRAVADKRQERQQLPVQIRKIIRHIRITLAQPRHMIIKEENRLKRWLVNKLLAVIYRIENIGNGHLTVSGEKDFIERLSLFYKGTMVVFDIGANIGEYSELILKNRGTAALDDYHLFEPQKSCFEILRNKFKGAKNMAINNIGLSNESGSATIFKNEEGSGLTSLYKRNLDFYHYKMDIKETITLDTSENYIARHNLKKIDLVKIDVEGNEINTLKGFGKYLRPGFIDFIQFEYGGANIDSHTNLLDFYELLEPKGFKICKIMKKHLEPRGYDPRFENFICQNYVAISKDVFDSITSNNKK